MSSGTGIGPPKFIGTIVWSSTSALISSSEASRIIRFLSIIGKAIAGSTEKTDTQSDTSGKYLYYTLKKGDTLWEIAKKYEGVTDRDLLRINGLTDGKSLKPGQQIKIKRLD
ncbi:MAG TPA: LysM domain-containing protein [Caldisericia bacterium]|nr:LysM domain-containing protein [Caldisericia bacterium]